MTTAPKAFLSLFLAATLATPAVPDFVGIGDSIGEGVQSGDANYITQWNSYLHFISRQMNVIFPLPLILGTPTSFVGDPAGRVRLVPGLPPSNLAVSGADTTSVLFDQAGGAIDTENDLVQMPRTGSQIQIAEQLRAPFMVCWIGNNDVLSSVISFDQLDASQLTSVPVFTANFQQIVRRLTAWRSKIVFGNIPNVTEIGFLFSPADVRRWLGNSYVLPPGHYTSIVAVVMIRLGMADASILQDPNFVLDPQEVRTIQDRITAFNQIIAQTASAAGMPVADINALFAYISNNPFPLPGGVNLTTKFNGGLFSLDGVHPSNFGHALAANAFIETANRAFNMGIPPLNNSQLYEVYRTDPFIDFDGDLRVKGRPLAGFIETLGPIAGISGDNDYLGSAPAPAVSSSLTTARSAGLAASAAPASADNSAANRFMQAYRQAIGRDPNAPWSRQDAIAAMRHVFSRRPR